MDKKEFWQLQKAANLSNSQAADYLDVNISTIKRYRNGQLNAPKAILLALKYKIETKQQLDEELVKHEFLRQCGET